MSLLTTKEDTNFARAAQIILNLFPRVLRNHLASLVDPSTLTNPVVLKKNKVKLHNEQSSIINNIPTVGNYGECDTTLLYYLFRHLPGVTITPIGGWNNKVKGTHLTPADDLERIRLLRNEVLGHTDKASLSDQDYSTFLKSAELILDRFDNCHGSTYPPYVDTGTYVKELKNIEGKVMDEKFNNYKQDLLLLKANELVLENKLQDVQVDIGTNKKRISIVEANVKATCDAIDSQFISIMDDIRDIKKICDEAKDESLAQYSELKEKMHCENGNRVEEQISEDSSTIEEQKSTNDENDSLFDNDHSVSHKQKIEKRLWYIWCHHSLSRNPSMLLHSYNIDLYLKQKILYKLYENGTTQHFTLQELNAKFLDKFHEIFGKEMSSQPWLFTNINEDCVSDGRFHKLCKTFEKWANFQNYAFLFVGYDYEENLRQLSFDVKKLTDDLKIEVNIESKNRITLFLAEHQTIFIIRYMDLKKSTNYTLEKEIRSGQNDLKIFSALHMDSLKHTGMCLISLLVVDNATKENLMEICPCEICHSTLILTVEDIKDARSLGDRLANLLKDRIECSHENILEVDAKTIFEIIVSRIWASMSIEDVHLPNFSIQDQNTLVRIYLNKRQRNFLHSTYNHVILRGGYGSGKSILAQVKFKELVNKAGVHDILYFLCFSNDTLYINMVKAHIEDVIPLTCHNDQIIIMNVDEYARTHNLHSPMKVSQILSDLAERHRGKYLYVIADELDGSVLSVDEASEIKLRLKNFSYILLVMQSLEVSRSVVRKKNILQRTKIVHDAHQFESTGMKPVILDHIMRNTTKINDLSRVATKIFKKHTNKYYERTFEESDPHDVDGVKIGNHASPKQDAGRGECVNGLEQEEKSPNYKESAGYHQHISKDNQVDHEMKVLSFHSQDYSTTVYESNFFFPGEWESGHSIAGVLPKVIYPFGATALNYENVNSRDTKSKIYFCLKDILNIANHISELSIISFDSIDAQLLFEAIRSMGHNVVLYAPALQLISDQKLDDLSSILKTHILITDHLGARGMEFKRLIVTFNPYEQHVAQYFVEAFTRAIFQLSFLVIYKDSNEVKENKHVCKTIIKKWIKHNLVDEIKVITCESHLSDFWQLPPHCYDTATKSTVYKIHPPHESFNICETITDIKEPIIDVGKAFSQLCSWAREKEAISCESKSWQDIRQKLQITKKSLSGSRVTCVIIGDQCVPFQDLLTIFSYGCHRCANQMNIPLSDSEVKDVEIDGELVELVVVTEDYAHVLNHDANVILLGFSINNRDSFGLVPQVLVPKIKEKRPGIPFLLVGIDENVQDGYLKTEKVPNHEGWDLAKEINAVAYLECSIYKRPNLVKIIFEIAARAALAQ